MTMWQSPTGRLGVARCGAAGEGQAVRGPGRVTIVGLGADSARGASRRLEASASGA